MCEQDACHRHGARPSVSSFIKPCQHNQYLVYSFHPTTNTFCVIGECLSQPNGTLCLRIHSNINIYWIVFDMASWYFHTLLSWWMNLPLGKLLRMQLKLHDDHRLTQLSNKHDITYSVIDLDDGFEWLVSILKYRVRSKKYAHVSMSIMFWCSKVPHGGRVTHICVGNLTIIGPDNGLSRGRRQAIIWTNAVILLIGPWRTNFIEILISIHIFSFKKIHLKM